MAGRTSSTRSCALLVAVAAALAGVATSRAGAAPADGPIVVAQTDTNVSMGLGWRDEGFNQKLGQTFVAPADAHKLARVTLVLGGSGTEAVVKVFEVGKNAPFGTLLAEKTVVVKGDWGDPGVEWQHMAIRPALRMDPDKRYSIVVKTARKKQSMAVAGGHGYEGGEWWCYCPDSSGKETDFENPKWQSAEALDNDETDFSFKLRFWRRG